jgi:arylformamidase
MEIIDISLTLHNDMPTWPTSSGIKLTRSQSMESGDPSNVSRLDCDVHTGTHIDAPRHFIENGITVDQLNLHQLIGPAIVACMPELDAVDASDLESLDLPRDCKRLLLQTRNSELWGKNISEFRKDYVALSQNAAKWIVDHGIDLIGVDYLSVQRYGDGPLTHQILFEGEVIIIEGLNLNGVAAGTYDLICLPLKLKDTEGSPARAVLLKSA